MKCTANVVGIFFPAAMPCRPPRVNPPGTAFAMAKDMTTKRNTALDPGKLWGWVGFSTAFLAITSCSTAHDFEAPKPLPELQPEILREVNPIRDLDILFVIDNSHSMRLEQDNLRKNFPKFMDVLQKIRGGLPDVHIGVVSTNVGAGNILIPGNSACSFPGGDRGQFKPPTDSGLEMGAKFIIATNGGKQNNFVGGATIAEVFSKMANLGIEGCGYEHQLQAARLALHENVTPTNTKFLRPEAFLAIIFITDEDDCSAPFESDFFVDPEYSAELQQPSLRCALAGHRCNGVFPTAGDFQTAITDCVADERGGGKLIPVDDIVNDIKRLKANPQRILVSGIMGKAADSASSRYSIARRGDKFDLQPVCSNGEASAAPALRMQQFIESFRGTDGSPSGSIESICQDDFGPALTNIARRIGTLVEPGCIESLLLDSDFDGANNVFVPECQLSQRVPNPVTGQTEETLIENRCNNAEDPAASTNKPCYAIVRNLSCTAVDANPAGGWSAEIYRDGEAPAGAIEIARCRVCGRTSKDAPEVKAGICR